MDKKAREAAKSIKKESDLDDFRKRLTKVTVETAFPETQIQLCIVHMVGSSMKYVTWKDYKAVAADLKAIYQSKTEDEALLGLEVFSDKWDAKYPQISRSWTAHWDNLITLRTSGERYTRPTPSSL